MINDSGAPGRAQQISTRIVFFIAGIGMAAWAPLVPFAKARAQIEDGMLGVLLLCLGVGSLLRDAAGGRADHEAGLPGGHHHGCAGAGSRAAPPCYVVEFAGADGEVCSFSAWDLGRSMWA